MAVAGSQKNGRRLKLNVAHIIKLLLQLKDAGFWDKKVCACTGLFLCARKK